MRSDTLALAFSSPRFTSALQPGDHPLFARLIDACRAGDLAGAKRLVAAEVPVNARDAFDATPLYYASLTGHAAVVEFLLAAGATADPATFEGERTLYAALTDPIRALLRSHKLTKRLDERQDFALWLASLLTGTRMLHRPETDHDHHAAADFHPDFYFHLSDEIIPAHRFLLAARSSYFAANLATRWRDRNFARVKRRVDPAIFRACVKWFYTGHADQDAVDDSQYPEWIETCRFLHLHELRAEVEKIQAIHKERAAFEREHGRRRGAAVRVRLGGDRGLTGKIEGIMGDLGFLAGCLLAASERPDAEKWVRAFDDSQHASKTSNENQEWTHAEVLRLAREFAILRSSHPAITNPLDPPLPPAWSPLISQLVSAAAPDALLLLGPEHAKTKLLVHRGVPRSRSPYFSAMLSGHFADAESTSISLSEPSDPVVARAVLHFLYSDSLLLESEPDVHALLPATCLLLLPRMTSLVASWILHPTREQKWTKRDVLRLLESSERLGVGRVENWATARVAGRLEEYLFPAAPSPSSDDPADEDEETVRDVLVQMIADSAGWVRERQSADSIPLLDDLRYHLLKRFGVDETPGMPVFGGGRVESDMELYSRLVRGLDEIREELGVEIVDVYAPKEYEPDIVFGKGGEPGWVRAEVGEATEAWIAEETDEGWMDLTAGLLGDEEEEAAREEAWMERMGRRGRA